MRFERILGGFPLRINVLLLSIAIGFAITVSRSGREDLTTVCLTIGGLLTLAAVGPASISSGWERLKKGKGKWAEDPDAIVPQWKQFCHSMGIEEDIKLRVFANLRNAYASGTTIEIGQPVLDSLDNVSTKGVLAHELAHIKRNHSLRRGRLFLCIGLGLGLLFGGILCGFNSLGPQLFPCGALSVVMIGLISIAMPFISWPFEYEADSMADQYVKEGAVASSLKVIARLRKMDVTRDFYWHPSINRRIANLDKSRRARFGK